MTLFALILLFGAATPTITSTTEKDTLETPKLPRKWPVVFGFEFTMDGIVTAAGLPNGTTIPIGVTQGSTAYRTEMSRLYSICEEVARTSTLPAIAQQYRTAGAPFRWTGDPHRWIGGPVTELRDAVVEAKRGALTTLSQRYGLNLDVNTTFHALAAAPTFIFTALKPSRARDPLTIWEMRNFNPENYPSLEAHSLARAWLSIMVVQFSQAVVEAGFHRCTIPYSWETQYSDMCSQNYDDFEFIHPAATHAICAAEVGTCALKFGVRTSFHEFGLTPCSYPGRVAVVADLWDAGLSLWAEGLDDCQLDSVPWNTLPELKPPPTDNISVTAWAQIVQRKIAKLLEDTASKSNTEDGVKLIPTGDAWTRDLLESLGNTTTAFTILKISLPESAASMNAAKAARFEEWSFHEFRLADDGWYFVRVQPRNEVTSFDPVVWMSNKDKLWTVGGGCLEHQECEYACKWRGAPMCHRRDHVCMCGELWEDEPGARREELHRDIWEADRKARQTVIRALSEVDQAQCPRRPGPYGAKSSERIPESWNCVCGC